MPNLLFNIFLTLDNIVQYDMCFRDIYTLIMINRSRGALMTGYYPYHIGMQHGIVNRYQPKFMPKDKETLPEALKKVGYATHMVGKYVYDVILFIF
jgi:arylsulfatase A-like enzyme